MKMISTNTITDNNEAKAGECGVVETIVSAMKTHMNNADVCEYGCGALWNITVNGKQ